MMRLLAAVLLLLGLAPPLAAQDLPQGFPAPVSTTVNDFAALLTPEDAAALDRALADLRAQTGVQGTVVTLGSSQGAPLESFATRLFNQWGVGHAARNDGFMLLVLAQDRAARIELGAGYPGDADILAQDIMRGTMLPAFRDGQMSRGIREGTQAVIAHIALPHAQGLGIDAPRRGWFERLFPFLFGGAWTLILAGMGWHLWRRNRCPQCGKRGLEQSSAPNSQPQPDGSVLISDQAVTRRCPHCGWSDTRLTPLASRSFYGPAGELLRQERNRAYRGSRAGSSGFGGGSSRGGGASGRW